MPTEILNGTKADELDPLVGAIPDEQIILVPDPTTGKILRTTFGQLKSDVIIAVGAISYLDTIVEVDTIADLPNPGVIKTIYVITTGADEGKQFRWGGSAYVEFPKGSGDVAAEALLRGNADAALQSAIDLEITNRTNSIASVNGNINAQATIRANADTALAALINSEVNARANADAYLLSLINQKLNITDYDTAYKAFYFFDTKTSFPEIGADRIIYIAKDTGLMFRYDLEAEDYVPVGGGSGSSGSPYCRATGTNTYIVVNDTPFTELPRSVLVSFQNKNTGAATIQFDALAPLPIKLNGAALINNNILNDQNKLLILSNDNTHYQLQSGTFELPPVASGEKIMSLKSDGIHADYDVKDANSASATTGATLEGLDWSSGTVNYAGVAGETRNYGNWKYECKSDGVWWRTPYNLIVSDIIIGSVSDSGGVKTSTQMAALYPNAVSPQIAKGTAGIYQYFGLSGWFYFENKIAI